MPAMCQCRPALLGGADTASQGHQVDHTILKGAGKSPACILACYVTEASSSPALLEAGVCRTNNASESGLRGVPMPTCSASSHRTQRNITVVSTGPVAKSAVLVRPSWPQIKQ